MSNLGRPLEANGGSRIAVKNYMISRNEDCIAKEGSSGFQSENEPVEAIGLYLAIVSRPLKGSLARSQAIKRPSENKRVIGDRVCRWKAEYPQEG